MTRSAKVEGTEFHGAILLIAAGIVITDPKSNNEVLVLRPHSK